MVDDPVVYWNTEFDRDARAAAAWSAAWKLFQTQGQAKKGVLQDALFVYFGNERHRLGGEYTGGFGILDLLGNLSEPPGQNVIQMIVDMMVSHTIRNKVRPFFLTEKGDVAEREGAQGMMRAVEGIFQNEKLFGPLGVATAKIGYIADGGFVKSVPDYARKKVTLQAVLPHEWLVPPREARKGNPRQGFHVYSADRAMLLEDYGWERDEDGKRVKTENYDIIKGCKTLPRSLSDDEVDQDSVSDQLLVVEAYHLPSGYVDLDDESAFGMKDGTLDETVDPGHDGRRMVMIGGGDGKSSHCLLDEPYPYEEFPVCEFFPSQNPVGYGSRGVPETLAAAQLAVNRYNRRIENIMHLHAVPRLIAWTMAKLNLNKVTNDVADILHSKVPANQAVNYLQPPGVPPELLNRVDKLIAWMKAQYGVNDMTLSGEKPKGLDHAPGMEHLLEETTLRHTEKFEAWNNFHVKLARRCIEACRMLALHDPDFEIYWGDNKELKRIKWKDVELSRKRFVVNVWPTSMVPKTPGMQMRRLGELLGMQVITPQQAQASLVDQYPDVAGMVGDAAAAERNIRAKLDKIAKDGYSEDTMPHPYMNLELCKVFAAEKINQFECDGVDESTIDEVRRFWEDANDLQLRETAANAQAQAGAAPAPGPPSVEAPPPLVAPEMPPGGAPPMPIA